MSCKRLMCWASGNGVHLGKGENGLLTLNISPLASNSKEHKGLGQLVIQ